MVDFNDNRIPSCGIIADIVEASFTWAKYRPGIKGAYGKSLQVRMVEQQRENVHDMGVLGRKQKPRDKKRKLEDVTGPCNDKISIT
ncbi:hypothetical protein QVD17_29636 [Tagetes erecta]|uniref:Uncharacterized protein n=1 Tax=Tagetes erecta TaxID=13708 RepID=A0AAD8NLG6_TARER|nr:hypothetical protein QVD17_29636 [Tagetes erecta]